MAAKNSTTIKSGNFITTFKDAYKQIAKQAPTGLEPATGAWGYSETSFTGEAHKENRNIVYCVKSPQDPSVNIMTLYQSNDGFGILTSGIHIHHTNTVGDVKKALKNIIK